MKLRSSRPLRVLAALVLGGMLGACPVSTSVQAHDFPDQVPMRGFVKPDGDHLHFLLRLPLEILLNIDLPKRGPGYLDLPRVDEGMTRAASAVTREFVLYEDGARLVPDGATMRISLPSEDAFGSYWQARAHIDGPPLPPTTNVFWNQGYFDVRLSYPIASTSSDFVLDMRFGGGIGERAKLTVDFLPPDGASRSFEIHGGHGWLELDPSRQYVARVFLELGVDQIFARIDLLLLLICLLAPLRLAEPHRILAIGGALLLAQTVALGAMAGSLVPIAIWFVPVLQALIALTIVGLAIDNVIGVWLGSDRSLRWRWLPAGLVGVMLGIVNRPVLDNQLGLAAQHDLIALLTFALGLASIQLAILILLLAALGLVLRPVWPRRIGLVIGSVLIGHTGWHWLLERAAALRYVRGLPLPELSPRWFLVAAAVVAIAIALGWLAAKLPLRNLQRRF